MHHEIPDLFKLEVGKLVHAHFQNKLPNSLSNLFFLTRDISSKALRFTNTNILYILRYRTNRLLEMHQVPGSQKNPINLLQIF